MYDKKDFGYFKKCLASNGEIMILNKETNKSATYAKNNRGKLEMKFKEGKIFFIIHIYNPP